MWRRRKESRVTLLMTANKPETTLSRAPTFSLLLAPHGGISSYILYIFLLLYPDLLARVFYSWVQVRNMGAVEKSDVGIAISYHEKRLLKKTFNAWYFAQVS